LALWIPVILILSLGALRPLKGLFIGVQYKFRSDGEKFSTDKNNGNDQSGF